MQDTPLSWHLAYLKLDQVFNETNNAKRTLKLYKYWLKLFQSLVNKEVSALDLADAVFFMKHLKENDWLDSSRYQAFTAIKFFFERVLGLYFDDSIEKPKRSQSPPLILTTAELNRIFDRLEQPYQLIAKLLYGCGLTTIECLSLRIKDLDFSRNRLHVIHEKKHQDRYVPIPKTLYGELENQILQAFLFHESCLEKKYNGVFLPENVSAEESKSLAYSWLFPAKMATRLTDEYKLYHLHDTHVQRAIKLAVRASRIKKKATCLSLRQTYAGHLLERNYSPETVQRLMGYSDIRLVAPYLKVIKKQALVHEEVSPLDF